MENLQNSVPSFPKIPKQKRNWPAITLAILLVLSLAGNVALAAVFLTFDQPVVEQAELAVSKPKPEAGTTLTVREYAATDYPYYLYDYDKADCLGIENGILNGRNLLDIVYDDTVETHVYSQNGFEADVYTADYLARLNDNVQRVASTSGQSFYGQYVCRVGKVDVVAGVHYEQGAEVPKDGFGADPIIYVSTADGVLEFPDIEVMDNTATGGETSPCGAEMKGGELVWSCFLGLSYDEDGSVTMGIMKDWILPLDGSPAIEGEQYES